MWQACHGRVYCDLLYTRYPLYVQSCIVSGSPIIYKPMQYQTIVSGVLWTQSAGIVIVLECGMRYANTARMHCLGCVLSLKQLFCALSVCMEGQSKPHLIGSGKFYTGSKMNKDSTAHARHIQAQWSPEWLVSIEYAALFQWMPALLIYFVSPGFLGKSAFSSCSAYCSTAFWCEILRLQKFTIWSCIVGTSRLTTAR